MSIKSSEPPCLHLCIIKRGVGQIMVPRKALLFSSQRQQAEKWMQGVMSLYHGPIIFFTKNDYNDCPHVAEGSASLCMAVVTINKLAMSSVTQDTRESLSSN